MRRPETVGIWVWSVHNCQGRKFLLQCDGLTGGLKESATSLTNPEQARWIQINVSKIGKVSVAECLTPICWGSLSRDVLEMNKSEYQRIRDLLLDDRVAHEDKETRVKQISSQPGRQISSRFLMLGTKHTSDWEKIFRTLSIPRHSDWQPQINRLAETLIPMLPPERSKQYGGPLEWMVEEAWIQELSEDTELKQRLRDIANGVTAKEPTTPQ